MKKKLRTTILIATMVFSVAACGKSEMNGEENTDVTVMYESNQHAEEELGICVKVNVFPPEDKPSASYYINLPSYYNYNQPRGCWQVSSSMELEGTAEDNYILMAGQCNYFEPVDSVEEVFPAYCVYIPEESGRFATTIKEILETETVEINGIEMCKYKGTCESLDNEGEVVQEKFVAYAAPLSGGGYGFFVVIGTRDDASIEKDADFVAATFRETEEIN